MPSAIDLTRKFDLILDLGAETLIYGIDQFAAIDQEQVDAVAIVPGKSFRDRGRPVHRAFKPAGELLELLGTDDGVVDQVFVRIEHAAIEVGDRRSHGLVAREHDDAGGEAPSCMWQDFPQEFLRVAFRTQGAPRSGRFLSTVSPRISWSGPRLR